MFLPTSKLDKWNWSCFYWKNIKRVFGSAIAVSACLNMLLPGAAKLHPVVFTLVRILQGLVEVQSVNCHYYFTAIYVLLISNDDDDPSGSNLSGVSRHLAVVGSSAGTIPISHFGILRILCWCCSWNALVRLVDGRYQLASAFLFLR